MNAYSKDLRIRVLAAVDRGERREEIVRLFGVSVATVGRWLRRRRESGEVAPRPSPGRTPSILRTAEERRALWRQLEENDEATLEEHRELWERTRVAAPPTLGNGNWTLQPVAVSIGQRGYGTTLRASRRERGTASRLAGPEGKSRA